MIQTYVRKSLPQRSCQGVVLLLALCGMPPVHAAQPIRVAVANALLSLPLYVAEHQKYLNDSDRSIQFVDCLSGKRCVEALRSGQVDLATASGFVFSAEIAKESELRLFATVASAPGETTVLARRGAGIKRVSDLAGQRVGYVPGTSSEYYLSTLMQLQGLPLSTVELVPLQPDKIREALDSRQINAVSIWQPWAFRMQQRSAGELLEFSNPDAYVTSFNLIGRTLRSGDAIRAAGTVLAAMVKASDFIDSNPAEARRILAERLEIDVSVLEAIWSSYDFRVQLRTSTLDMIAKQVRWRLRQDGPDSGSLPDVRVYTDAEPLIRIDKQRVDAELIRPKQP